MGIPMFLYEEDNNNHFKHDSGRKRSLPRSDSSSIPRVDSKRLLTEFFWRRQNNVRFVDEQLKNSLQSWISRSSSTSNNNMANVRINHNWSMNRLGSTGNDELNELLKSSVLTDDLKSSGKNNSTQFWIFHLNDLNKIVIYDFIKNSLFQIHLLDFIQIHDIVTCIDARYQDNDSTLVVTIGLGNGDLYYMTFDGDSNISNLKKFNIANNFAISDVSLALFNELRYVVSFNNYHGIILTNVDSSYNYCIPLSMEFEQDLKAVIDFPQLTVFNSSKIWHFPNVMDYIGTDMTDNSSYVSNEVKVMLKPNEVIKDLSLSKKLGSSVAPLLMVDTNQRILSISNYANDINHFGNDDSTNWYKNTHTILYKSLWNTDNYEISHYNKYAVVSNHHLYDTSVTIYEHSPISDEWIFLGYSDIRAKFNIKRVKNLSITNNCTINLLSDTNENYQFNISTFQQRA
ncbi:hypothetical protein Kpol_1033p47 [Vanderwaltozyma polyspora DSM 70294]|uniref:Protein SWT21 n=1 Tax=Vanderwaltozyma polyspora (strain ATCC 22028 / DSM 70294 / BCRC 21397 / CBS 2163 / NBRC 10782 / NRRL Y-8283 / UCD 57-17) TaxID=436907 RepID=A7TJ42_VANPO|nr:uncharacterized protein Kpol_1033p47 [Vanderwaltozyma polyspora DSM 70294]EDO17741.1 hypothetical protein Kpol_1033p47 [Vanderwaltozyma polyspora DSM 70294]